MRRSVFKSSMRVSTATVTGETILESCLKSKDPETLVSAMGSDAISESRTHRQTRRHAALHPRQGLQGGTLMRLGFLHWDYYLVLENDLLSCRRYVEFHSTNMQVYSIEFVRILLATCSEIDVVAKGLCKM